MKNNNYTYIKRVYNHIVQYTIVYNKSKGDIFVFFFNFYLITFMQKLFNNDPKKFIPDSFIPLYAISSSTACPEPLGKAVYLHQGQPTTLSCQPIKQHNLFRRIENFAIVDDVSSHPSGDTLFAE